MTMAQEQKVKRSDMLNKQRGLLQHVNEIIIMSYIKTFGIRFQLTPRVPARLIELDEPAEDETAKYEFKPRKTRKAFDGRQQGRKTKTIELNKDIRKSEKNFAKVMITNAYISSTDDSDASPVLPSASAKPSKQDAYTKTKLRNNKRNYKAQQEVTAAAVADF